MLANGTVLHYVSLHC